MAHDERTAERVRALLEARGEFVEKKMMGGICFMVGGHMCCAVSSQWDLLVRIAAQDYQAMLAGPLVQPMRMGRRVMRGFVRVSPAGYKSAAHLRGWVDRGVACALALPPKAARRRR
jgi:TfoX/Sxy family transcriptional regulator of competence genes